MDQVFKYLKGKNVSVETLQDLLTNTLKGNEEWTTETKQGVGILHFVVNTEDLPIIKTVVEASPVFMFKHCDSNSQLPVLAFAITVVGNVDIVKLLLNYPLLAAGCTEKTGLSPLHWACMINSTSIASVLITSHCDLNDQNSANGGKGEIVEVAFFIFCIVDSPLHTACRHSAEETIRLLIDAGAQPCLANFKQERPIHLAVEYSLTNILPLLVGFKEFNPDAYVDQDGNSPLHIAYSKKLSKIGQFLLSSGFRDDKPNRLGQTAKMIKAQWIVKDERQKLEKSSEIQDRRKEKDKRKEMRMQKTEVSQFCNLHNLHDLCRLFFEKKILFDDEYFRNLQADQLLKIGFTSSQSCRLLEVFDKCEKEKKEEEMRMEAEARRLSQSRRFWERVKACAIVFIFFLLIFFVIKIQETLQRTKKHGVA